jgi:CRISPR-associated endonuclease Cas3-HD
MNREYYAHSAPKGGGRPELLKVHLSNVARRAALNAKAFGAEHEAHIAGLLHDLGKYGDLFQRRLEGKEKGIDHWSPGAWVALSTYHNLGIASALAIQGHHIGLQQAARDSLRSLNSDTLTTSHPLGLRLSDPDRSRLLERLAHDGIVLPGSDFASVYAGAAEPAAAMLDVRMLFSALVDADFVETEAHFGRDSRGARQYREPGPALEAGRALEALLDYVGSVASFSDASSAVKTMRTNLLQACLAAGDSEPGLFTLTAPTGSGKTLSMLAFALRHAGHHGLRRVITVIPYLTIIDQTVREYSKVFESVAAAGRTGQYVLEHHSLANSPRGEGQSGADSEDEASRRRRELAENWDAPIVVTTSVQFLESLLSNRPSACRKLHRLARSVILFDEVQTLPTDLAIPTLATLSRLSERYRATVVFATATQPAFSHLGEHVKNFCVSGWDPIEVVLAGTTLLGPTKRASVEWPNLDRPTSWAELANQIISAPARQVLCIVNLKRHALALFWELEGRGVDGLFISPPTCVPLTDRRNLMRSASGCPEGSLVVWYRPNASKPVWMSISLRFFEPLPHWTPSSRRPGVATATTGEPLAPCMYLFRRKRNTPTQLMSKAQA